MKASEAEVRSIEAELEKVFDPDLTQFEMRALPLTNVIYHLDYPSKGLKIVVTTPLKYKGFDEYEIEKGRVVKFEIYCREKKCLEFTNSRIIDGWEKVAKEKLDTLKELVELAPHCPTCNAQTFPNKGKDFQVNPRGTEFVWYTCIEKKCGNNAHTPYRSKTRLKSRVARFLRKSA